MKSIWIPAIAAVAFTAGYMFKGPDSKYAPPDPAPREYREPVMKALPPSIVTPDAESPPEFADLLSQPNVFATLHLAYQLAAEADPDTLAALATEALRYDDPLLSFSLADIFVERMNAIDVNSALDFAESLPNGLQRYQLLTSIHNTWRRKDPEAAAAYAASVDDPTLQRMLAVATARDNPSTSMVSSSSGQIVNSIGISTGYGFRNEQRAEIRQRLLTMQSELRQDPEATMEALLQEPDSVTRQAILPSAIIQLAQDDPQLALDLLARYPDELREHEGSILSMMANRDPAAVAELAEDFARRTGNTGPMDQVLATLMKSDVNLALAEFDRVPEQFKPEVAMNLGMQYVQQDPEAALRWMLQQPTSTPYLHVALSVASAEAQSTAEAMMLDMPPGEGRSAMLTALAYTRSERSAAATVDWLAQYEAEAGYEAAIRSTLSRWAYQDPLAAVAHLESNPGLADADLAANIAQQWVTRDPESAIAWVDELSDPALKTSASGALVSALGGRDPVRAEQVYAAMPDGPDKYRAGADLAMRFTSGNRRAAREKMAELGVPEEYIANYMSIVYR